MRIRLQLLTYLNLHYRFLFSTKWGSRVVVGLADITWIKKAMNHPDLQGRGDPYIFTVFNNFKNLGKLKEDCYLNVADRN